VWVFQNWQTSLSTIASHAASFTHVSPSLYEINYDYTQGVPQFAFGSVDDFGGLTSQQICQQVQAAGLKCVPLIFGGADNSGTDQGIQNILNNSSNAQTNFIAALISEGKAKGYDGWNLDWEVGNGTGYSGYGTELIGFLSALRQQLNQNGMILSTDIINNMMKQSYCSGGQGLIDLTQIGQVVDSVIDENYQPAIWTGSGPTPAACPASLANPLPCQEDVVTDLEPALRLRPARERRQRRPDQPRPERHCRSGVHGRRELWLQIDLPVAQRQSLAGFHRVLTQLEQLAESGAAVPGAEVSSHSLISKMVSHAR
jgi:hypothetical protein